MFQSTYDSTGSSGLYDNYNSVTNNGNEGNGPYSSTNGNGSGPYSSPMGNDGGYRSSRSSYGAAPSGNGHGDDRDRYRYGRFAHGPRKFVIFCLRFTSHMIGFQIRRL